MAEGKKLYKLATELNLGREALIEFLVSKGFGVKNHMATVTPEMEEVVLGHFKKEKESAEKHVKKVEAFKVSKTRAQDEAERRRAEVKGGVAKKEEAPAKTTTRKKKKQDEEVVAEQGEEIEAVSQEIIASEEAAVEARAQEEVIAPEPVPLTAEEHATREKHKAHEHEVKRKAKQKADIGKRPQLQGLTIMGKIDLHPLGDAAGSRSTAVKPTDAAGKKKKKKKKTVREEVSTVAVKEFGETTAAGREKAKRGRERRSVDKVAAEATLRRTLASPTGPSMRGRAKARTQRRKERAEETERVQTEFTEKEKSIIRATEFLTALELANLMNVQVSDVIAKCIALGMMVSINQRLEKDTITLVADEFGFTVEFQTEFSTEELEDAPDDPETLVRRPPVVTIMGHVDHGKTSLLDYIRKANVVAGESGGITQHIGAYKVELPSGQHIAFLDTPGHEAFTAMRARGAQVTDLVVLVVAADDSVMPQTIEAINHSLAAGVPIVVAINKVDRPDANPERIRQQLADRNILVEDWGGKYQCAEISARSGKGVSELLDKILLEAEVLDLKANAKRHARGVVVESELDKGKGIVGTVLVQKGTLNVGDVFLCGINYGRVRAMFDERGHRVETAPPSTPVQVLGFEGIPQAGDELIAMESERQAKDLANVRQQLKREQDFKQHRMLTLDEISKQIQIGGVKNLRIVLKGDVDGSIEALGDSLIKLSTKEVRVEIIHKAVGAISESDVLLASASGAIIVGFHVRPNLNARKLAEKESIDIRLYNIIYDCINEIRAALEGMLSPEVKEEVVATVTVREIFKVPKVGVVAGCYVNDGKIMRNNKVRLLRDGLEVFNGSIHALRRFKDDVREVESGFECGLSLENFNDIKVGDIVEAYKMVELKRTLDDVQA